MKAISKLNEMLGVCVCMCVCVCVCACGVCVCVCMHECMQVCMYGCMHITNLADMHEVHLYCPSRCSYGILALDPEHASLGASGHGLC